MSAVIEELARSEAMHRAEERRAKRKAEEDFAATVAILADGENPDPDEVQAVLTAAGKNVAELTGAVAFRAARLRAAEVLAKLPAAEAAVADAAAAVEKLEVERVAALNEFNEKIKAAKLAHKKTVAGLEPLHGARAHLLATGPEHHRQEINRVQYESRTRRARLEELADAIRRASDQLSRGLIFANVGSPGYDPRMREYYSPAERSALTRDRFAWVNVEEHAREKAAAKTHNELFEAATARGLRPNDTWDRERIIAEEREGYRQQFIATSRREAQEKIDAMRSEVATIEEEIRQLQECACAAEAALLVP